MSNELWLGFIGAVVVSAVLNAIVNKMVTRKPETCIIHEDTVRKSELEKTNLSTEVQEVRHEMGDLNACYHRLDKKLDVFIETSKVRQDVLIELSGAIKSMVTLIKEKV